jgi:hypothetical protein
MKMLATLLFAASFCLAQTQLGLDQATLFSWSPGLANQYIAPNQVRVPAVHFSVAGSTILINDGACSVTVNDPSTAGHVYVFWRGGQITVLAGNWNNGVYLSTAQRVSIVGPCSASEINAADNTVPKHIQAMLWFGSFGSPTSTVPLKGACCPFWPYSYDMDNSGLLRVTRGASSVTPSGDCSS